MKSMGVSYIQDLLSEDTAASIKLQIGYARLLVDPLSAAGPGYTNIRVGAHHPENRDSPQITIA